MSTALIAAVASIGGALASGGLWGFLISRRTASGQVATTPAETLWLQMQSILTSALARADKAEEQRDKLLDGYAQIAPTLASIDSSLRKLLDVTATTQGSDPP